MRTLNVSGYGEHDDSHRRGGSFGDRSRNFPPGRTNSKGIFIHYFLLYDLNLRANILLTDTRYESRESPRDARFGNRSERAPQPLPTAPPYTAHLGNLPFDLTEPEVENFFKGSKVRNFLLDFYISNVFF